MGTTHALHHCVSLLLTAQILAALGEALLHLQRIDGVAAEEHGQTRNANWQRSDISRKGAGVAQRAVHEQLQRQAAAPQLLGHLRHQRGDTRVDGLVEGQLTCPWKLDQRPAGVYRLRTKA